MPRHRPFDRRQLRERFLYRRLSRDLPTDPRRKENRTDAALALPWNIHRSVRVPLPQIKISEHEPLRCVGMRVYHQRSKMNLTRLARNFSSNLQKPLSQVAPQE